MPLQHIFNKWSALLTLITMVFSGFAFLGTKGFIINDYAGPGNNFYVEDLMGVGTDDNIMMLMVSMVGFVAFVIMALIPGKLRIVFSIIGLLLLFLQLFPLRLMESFTPSTMVFDTISNGNGALIIWALCIVIYVLQLTGMAVLGMTKIAQKFS